MAKDRDAMHAAGGNFMAAQIAAEGRGSNAANEAATQPQQRQSRGPRAVLNLKEDYDLTAWLHGREPVWGETAQDVFEKAVRAFPSMSKLNKDHIATRMDAFADSLPKAKPPVVELTVVQRLERAERLLAHFAGWFAAGDMSQEGRNEVAAYYTQSNV